MEWGAIATWKGTDLLQAAAELKNANIECVVLEGSAAVGASWRARYDRLHLHTSRDISGLPFVPFPSMLRGTPTAIFQSRHIRLSRLSALSSLDSLVSRLSRLSTLSSLLDVPLTIPGNFPHFPSRDDVVAYLEGYTAMLDLPVFTRHRVTSCVHDGTHWNVMVNVCSGGEGGV